MSSVPTNKQVPAADLSRLQERLGYTFKQPELLTLALTHKSFSKNNNERLEFLGDAVLGYLIGAMLYAREESFAEDALSLMRANLVRGTTLADIARALDIAPLLRLGSGERKSGGRQRDSILADALEAIIGAVHEDGGAAACRAVVESLYAQRVAVLDPQNLKDAKTKLQELLQGAQLDLPAYRVEQVEGADHQRRYTVVCEVPALEASSQATATSRRGAEQAAAADMLEQLETSGRLSKKS